jgi:hypothetical protein
MNDLFHREKFAHLPKAISTEGKRADTYEVGEIASWSPGGRERSRIFAKTRSKDFSPRLENDSATSLHKRRVLMTAWTSDELKKIGRADELKIAPLRGDDTPRKPVTIWVVRLVDDLYVRSYKGHGGAWFRTAQVRHEGRIRAGGLEKDVTFVEETDPA